MPIAVRFENVSKQYRLGQVGTGTISRDLERGWAKLRGRPDPYSTVGLDRDPATADNHSAAAGADYVWAIKDLSLDVQQGEVLGIIGRNGAGKSTLLKLLSRVTAPTHGTIRIKGSIASLLEVGTGFHPELTGRENVFLNAAILGMNRNTTQSRFDEIVEFSGCSRYIDTPVKRYSSGMIVRLGFSVAAHLDCETLIVDEVLAVGDIDFQRRCIDKMQAVAAAGRTILLVSHNMTTMARMCDRCALLKDGRLDFLGTASAAIDRYLQENNDLLAAVDLDQYEPRSGSGRVRLQKFWIENDAGSLCSTFASGDTVCFCFSLRAGGDLVDKIDVGFSIHELDGEIVTGMYSAVAGHEYSVDGQPSTIRCRLDNLPLPEGRYTIAVRVVTRGEELDWPRGMIAAFDVVDGDFYGQGRPVSHQNLKFLVSALWSDEK